MEQKLREFKSRRKREILLSKPKEFVKRLISKLKVPFSRKVPDNFEGLNSPSGANAKEYLPINSTVLEDNEGNVSPMISRDSSFAQFTLPLITKLIYILYFLLWLIIYLIAIQLEFGFVYIVVSGLIFIYFNTRTGPKKAGEVSAYSVFNPGCEAIQGTLKAEHLEREFNLIHHDKPNYNT